MKCFYCQKMGHIKRVLDCGKENRRKKSDVQKNDRERCNHSDWMIDSSVLFYVTAYHDYFTSYVNSDYGHIRMRNKGASKIVGI